MICGKLTKLWLLKVEKFYRRLYGGKGGGGGGGGSEGGGGGAPPPPPPRLDGAEGVARQPYKGLLIFATLRSYILARLQRISDLAVFTNIKTLFPVV